jgi:hypothetical protein
MYQVNTASMIPITLKWGKKTFIGKIAIKPPLPANTSSSSSTSKIPSPAKDLMHQVQTLTNVPIERQKLLCPKCWKGILKIPNDDAGDNPNSSAEKQQQNLRLVIPKGKDSILVTLIGSADVLIEKSNEDTNMKNLENMSCNEEFGIETKAIEKQDSISTAPATVGDIVALQRLPGEDRNDGNKMGMYQYNRLVTGLPQQQIENKLKLRRQLSQSKNGSNDDETKGSKGVEVSECNNDNDPNTSLLLDEVVMTMGLELRRAYVNSIAVLDNDGTIVSALDDGHVQMWRRGELWNDIIHQGYGRGGVDKVVAFQSRITSSVGGHDEFDEKFDGPAFATGGRGSIRVWSKDGNCIMGIQTPPGTSPTSLATGSISTNNSNNIPSTLTSDQNDHNLNPNYQGTMYLLASCLKKTRQSDPNQFRLVPLDEEGRQRREVAQEQERMIQQELHLQSKRVYVYVYVGSRTNSRSSSASSLGSGLGFRNFILEPRNGRDASVTSVTIIGEKIVCADEWGGLRIFKSSCSSGTGDLNTVSFEDASLIQLQCERSSNCKIACLEPIQDDILAVSTDINQRFVNSNVEGEEEVGSRFDSSVSSSPMIMLQVPNPQAVYLVDLEKALIKVVLNAHSDVVQCICPLPNGGLLSGGGKMDATIRVWEGSVISTALNGKADTEAKGESEVAVLTEANKLKELGYVFDLKVLPDSEAGSNLYAIAGARYNVIKILI